MTIPVQNVYYLLCYAWDMFAEGRANDIASERFRSLPDLFAHVLETGMANLLKRGLDRGYVAEADDTRSLKGKFDLSTTVKRNLLLRSSVHCVFDSLLHDVLHNRIIKSTLLRLARCENLDRELRTGALRLHRRLQGISEVELSPSIFDRVVLHRNNRFYAFLIEVCRILYQSLLVNPQSGSTRFRDFLQDERFMARLFERFVRNFYRRERPELQPRREQIMWQTVEGSPLALAYLPVMQTDVTMVSGLRKIIIDTKYYASCLQRYHGASKVHSAHLYQLLAYLANGTRTPGQALEGILLYPTVDTTLDLHYQMHGHRVRVATLNLDRPWQEIESRLLSLLEPDGSSQVA